MSAAKSHRQLDIGRLSVEVATAGFGETEERFLRMLHQAIARRGSQHKLRVVLLIDEAHMLPLSVLDQMQGYLLASSRLPLPMESSSPRVAPR
jgi:hypothetical protein